MELTTDAWIPKPSNAFLYISRLFFALLVTKRMFFPTRQGISEN